MLIKNVIVFNSSGISLSLRILHGHLDSLKTNMPLVFNKNLVMARKIGFSDYISPGRSKVKEETKQELMN